MELPIEVQDAFDALAIPGEAIEFGASAGSDWILLSPVAVYVGTAALQRFPRGWVTGIEMDRATRGAGAMALVGRDGILASVTFSAAERTALVGLESRLAAGLPAPVAPVIASPPSARSKGITIVLDRPDFSPGEHVRGAVVVDWPTDSPVRGIRAGLSGTERTRIAVTSGSGQRRHSRVYREEHWLINEEATLFGREPISFLRAVGEGVRALVGRLKHPVLKRGRHEFSFDFALPLRALPSHGGPHADVQYILYAHVDVPLGFDMTTQGSIPVLSPRGSRIAGTSGDHHFEASGLMSGFKASGDATIELNGAPLVPGSALEGRVLAKNTSRKKLKSARFSLKSIESARAGRHERTTEAEIASGVLRVPDPSAGEIEAVFGLILPPEASIFSGRHAEVWLALDVTLEFAWSFDVTARLPLTMERR